MRCVVVWHALDTRFFVDLKMNLDSHGAAGPVTALCVYNNYIFAGCGSQIEVYNAKNACELLTSIPGLHCSTVHGLKLGPVLDGQRCICVFGAKSVRIFKLDETVQEGCENQDAHCLRLKAATAVTEFEDWIWTAVWLQNKETEASWTLALALAHNVVLHWDWQADVLLHRVICTEKCILYCGHFIGRRWTDLVLAAGTVFNQVVLWSPGGVVYSDDTSVSQPVLHRLTGHKGVIFSIFYHHGLQRICSASDDRSIIIYQLCSSTSSSEPSLSGDDTESVDWTSVIIEPLVTVFGHSGRVWDVILLADHFVSIGEDAHCIVWNYSGDIVHKHKGHQGQSIWSLAVSEDESYVVTGGGDCSIRKWQLCKKQDSSLIQTQLVIPEDQKICAEDFVRTLTLWDFDNLVLITNAGSILCYCISIDTWQVLAHDADFASYAALAVSSHTVYLAIASISGHVRIFCRGSCHLGTGHALKETKVKVHLSKVCGLTWVDSDHILTTGLNGLCILSKVQCSSDNLPVVTTRAQLELPACKHRWVVSGCLISSSSSSSSSLSSSLSSVKETWAHLVCGDRSGSVHCYQVSKSQESVLLPSQTFKKLHGNAGVTCVCQHKDTIYTAGRDGMYRRWTLDSGHLKLLNTSRVFKGFDWIDRLWIGDGGQFILGFHSSKFIVWDAGQGEQLLEVECGGGHRSWDCQVQGHSYRFCFIKAREAVVVDGGQRATQDIVKPPLHGKKVWDMNCLFAYTDNQGRVQHVMCTGSEDTTLSLGVLASHSNGRSLQWTGQHTLHAHLSSVRAITTSKSSLTPRDKIMKPHSQSEEDVLCHTPDDMYSGKERYSSTCHATSKVVFSAGGRAQFQAWRATVVEQDNATCKTVYNQGVCEQGTTSHHSAVKQPLPATAHDIDNLQSSDQKTEDQRHTCKPSCSPKSTKHTLTTSYEHLSGCFLGESRHKRSHKPWKTRYLKLDPETRVMCLTAISAQQLHSLLPAHLHLLAAAGSDGILRLFVFDEQNRHFTLLSQSSHHNGCILKVFIHLHCTTPAPHLDPASNLNTNLTQHVPILLSAATDGRIAIWDLQPVVEWLMVNASCFSSDPSCGQTDSCLSEEDTSSLRTVETESSLGTQQDFCQEGQKPSVRKDSGDGNDNQGVHDSEDTSTQSVNTPSALTRTQYIGDALTTLFYPPARHAKVSGPSLTRDGVEKWEEGEGRQDWRPNQEVVAHQSGVNSLHCKSLSDGSLLLASGGDDNALTVHRLILAAPETDRDRGNTAQPLPLCHVSAKMSKPDAHGAQITGVWILSKTHVLTVSVDQRVNLWRLTHDSQIKLEKCHFVDIADPSNIDVWQHGGRVYVGVCGEGLALLSVYNQAADDNSETAQDNAGEH